MTFVSGCVKTLHTCFLSDGGVCKIPSDNPLVVRSVASEMNYRTDTVLVASARAEQSRQRQLGPKPITP